MGLIHVVKDCMRFIKRKTDLCHSDSTNRKITFFTTEDALTAYLVLFFVIYKQLFLEDFFLTTLEKNRDMFCNKKINNT